MIGWKLYLIEILHQTTTPAALRSLLVVLYLIEILHQTTTSSRARACSLCCILSKFYIKPQHDRYVKHSTCVVSYRNSTSNHNWKRSIRIFAKVVSYRNSTSNHNSGTTTPNSALLYLIEILHQTTTRAALQSLLVGCILSKFYIKPQHTSATTSGSTSCILSKFYIKPQPITRVSFIPHRCILSKFYIKPQLRWRSHCSWWVVSYRNSTSNHNSEFVINSVTPLYLIEILHQTTTHGAGRILGDRVVSYRNSTSNHNVGPHID